MIVAVLIICTSCNIYRTFFVFFSVGVNLVVSTSAVSCIVRPACKMTHYVSCGTLNYTRPLTARHTTCIDGLVGRLYV